MRRLNLAIAICFVAMGAAKDLPDTETVGTFKVSDKITVLMVEHVKPTSVSKPGMKIEKADSPSTGKIKPAREMDRMQTEVVEILPNGKLKIQGHKFLSTRRRTLFSSRRVTTKYELQGTVSEKDVLPDNTVFSENLANLRITKTEVPANSTRRAKTRPWWRVFPRWRLGGGA